MPIIDHRLPESISIYPDVPGNRLSIDPSDHRAIKPINHLLIDEHDDRLTRIKDARNSVDSLHRKNRENRENRDYDISTTIPPPLDTIAAIEADTFWRIPDEIDNGDFAADETMTTTKIDSFDSSRLPIDRLKLPDNHDMHLPCRNDVDRSDAGISSRNDDDDVSRCSLRSSSRISSGANSEGAAAMDGAARDGANLLVPLKRNAQTQYDIHGMDAVCGAGGGGREDVLSKCSDTSLQRSIPSDSGGGGSICSVKSKRSILV